MQELNGIKYKIPTRLNLFECLTDEGKLFNLHQQQKELVDFDTTKYYSCQFINDDYSKTELFHDKLENIVECLAIKDGIDVIETIDGKVGIVAYYNAHREILLWNEITEDEFED